MSYKTILVHVTKSPRTEERIRLAANIAIREEAHLVGAAVTGISKLIQDPSDSDQAQYPVPGHLVARVDALRERAAEALREFDQMVPALGIDSFESILIHDEAGPGISLRARYSDLVVIGQTNPDDPYPDVYSGFPEYMVMHAGRPVLVIPSAGSFQNVSDRIVIGWDASSAASRAINNALPFLRQARLVEVAIFNPTTESDCHGEEPGADIALFLARHGVKVNINLRNTNHDIGQALLAFAAEVDAGLIVMGGYGHSRLREMLLGGVTLTVLAKMKIPVLMSN